ETVQHVAAMTARRSGVPYVFRPCGMLDPWSLSQNRWVKRLFLAVRLRRDLNAAAAVHYTAEAERDLAAPVELNPPTIVEPNGVDLDAFHRLPPRGAFRQQYGIPQDHAIVLFLSRIHPKKGLDLLIPAFAKVVAAAGPSKRVLVLAGPDHDAYRSTVEAIIDQHGLTERAVWTGMLRGADKVQAYVDADLFVLPSYQENFGIVVAEAMAAGLPVVISDKVNLDRDVVAARAGSVVPTQVEPLAVELVRWLADPELRRTAGLAGRQYAFERFDWQAIARRWTDHYARLIANRPA
ncbi:MAG TPA: glycosyltransferase, partial [Tepidisphaeraceae bacterium]|nr:glycosyltransferase [Tepidisphaeraceae bacterium]